MTPNSRSLFRPKGWPAVDTKMDDFEAGLREVWCHYNAGSGSNRMRCGAAREVPLHHGGPVATDGRCRGCGHLKCPDCVRLGPGHA